MMKKLLTVLTGLIILTGLLSAETEIESNLNIRFDVSADIGGVFDGWDADFSGGLVSSLSILPRKKLIIKDIPVSQYRDEVFSQGFDGFSMPNMPTLDPQSSQDVLKRLNLITDLTNRSAVLYNDLTNGKISKEEYDKKTEPIIESNKKLDAEMNAVVVESTFMELEKFSFGITSGYYFSSLMVEQESENSFRDERNFESFSFIPAMVNFQHNFSPISGRMRHLYTEVEIPYENETKTLRWTYHNDQIFAFYKISAGAGIVNENDIITAAYIPMGRIELGIGSYDGLFSIINTSVGYQHLFGYKGSLFINWCLAIQ